MISRRKLLAAAGGGMVVSLAGCALLEDEIERSAGVARVREDAQQGTGFDGPDFEELSFEETVEVSDESRDLKLTNWITKYDKAPSEFLGGGDLSAANFYIFTTPTISVAGRSANPFERFGEERFISAILERTERGDTDDLEEAGEHSLDILDESVELTEYETVQQIGGENIDVRLHFTTLTHDGDLLGVLGAYPKELDESENIYQLAEGIEHPVDP